MVIAKPNNTPSRGSMGRMHLKIAFILSSTGYLVYSSICAVDLNSIIHNAPTAINDKQLYPPTAHLAFGLSGNESGFISEFEVALKSVLLNAPLESDMHVHIIADRDAYQVLNDVFNRTQLQTWVTRNTIEIHAYDITLDLHHLERLLNYTLSEAHSRDPTFTVNETRAGFSIGAYFRLIANHFIPPYVKHYLYMDTDVVIMANLGQVFQDIMANPDSLFHWGRDLCSGFVVFNALRMDEIWKLSAASPLENISRTDPTAVADQLLLIAVNVTYSHEVALLEYGWDMNVAYKWIYYDTLVEKIPNVGMLHFNGGRDGAAYWTNHDFISEYPDTWRNGNYSASLPWSWARYRAKTYIRRRRGQMGHKINITSWGTAQRLDRRPFPVGF
jgi:hypothetical protein